MLGLFDKKPDHPMADIKSAQKLLDDIPKNDALKAMQELTTWIESVREQAGFRLDHQLAVLRLLDETARAFERKLAREYFASCALSEFQENRLWMALNEFSMQMTQAYLGVLARYRNGDKGSSAIKSLLPLIALRGIGAAAGRLKCAAARHALADDAIWAGMAEFYAHAEAQQYLDEPVQPYSGAGANTSVHCEFARVLMWYASSADTLNRVQMHLAERLMAHLCGDFMASRQCGPGSLFCFDLLHPAPPARMSAETKMHSGLRFLGADSFHPHLDALLKTMEKNIVPEEINLGGVYEAGIVRDVVRHLSGCFAPTPPKRRNARRSIKVNLEVVSGFSKILEQTDIGLNFGGSTNMTWQVEDISAGGLHCVSPTPNVKGIAIGSLIGIKPEKVDRWGVGVVRRFRRDRQNIMHIGLEMLTNQAVGVGLYGDNADEEQPALWLQGSGGDAGEIRILMGSDSFSGSRSLHAKVAGKNYLLMPLALVEKGADYDLARFRQIEEDTSEGDAY